VVNLDIIDDVIIIEGIGYDSNVYIFEDVIVDTGTGDNFNYIKSSMESAGINIEDLSLIVNTHNHFDHIGGNKCFDLDVAMHIEDARAIEEKNGDVTVASMFGRSMEGLKVDRKLKESDKIHNFEVIHTPGHTNGGICLYNGKTLISGDTVFSDGGFGRMDIGGNVQDMKNSLERLSQLDIEYLLPGHGPWTDNGSEHVKLAFKMLQRY
jgi:glyoxylase-like metal-dependent hydrolase (beta-lactamase superfamily II)